MDYPEDLKAREDITSLEGNFYIKKNKGILHMSQIQARADMKDAIKRTLIEFDVLSRKLKVIKSSEEVFSSPHKKKVELEKELNKCKEKQQKVVQNFNEIENICENLINENAKKHKRKINKLYGKLNKFVEENKTLQENIDSIQEKIKVLQTSGTMDQNAIRNLEEEYNTSFEIIQGFWHEIPEVYREAENETGIYFFTSPNI